MPVKFLSEEYTDMYSLYPVSHVETGGKEYYERRNRIVCSQCL